MNQSVSYPRWLFGVIGGAFLLAACGRNASTGQVGPSMSEEGNTGGSDGGSTSHTISGSGDGGADMGGDGGASPSGVGGRNGTAAAGNSGAGGSAAPSGVGGDDASGGGASGSAGASSTGGQSAGGASTTPETNTDYMCSRAPWSSVSEVVLARTDLGVLDLVHADGRTTHVDLTYTGDSNGQEVHSELKVVANQSRVAVVRYVLGGARDAVFVMFDRADGRELFRVEFPDLYLHRDILLASDGSAVLNLRKPVGDANCINEPDGCDHLAVIDAEGGHALFYGLVPDGPRAGGSVLVRPAVEERGTVRGWFDTETEEITPLQRLGDSVGSERRLEDSMIHLARSGDVVEVVTETPGAGDATAIDGLAALLDSELERFAAGNHLYFGPDEAGTLSDLDLENGTLSTMDVPLPDGLSPFGCYDDRVVIDDVGDVLRGARDAESARLLRWQGGQWQQLGTAVTGIQELEFEARGSTFLLRSWPPASLFCDESTWEPASDDVLEGESLQLVRPADSIHQLLESGRYPVLNANGTCYFLLDAAGLFVHDVFRDEPVRLFDDGRLFWIGPS